MTRDAACRARPGPAFATVRAMSDDEQDEGIRDRISRQGEETLGKIAEELVGNPLVAGALARRPAPGRLGVEASRQRRRPER